MMNDVQRRKRTETQIDRIKATVDRKHPGLTVIPDGAPPLNTIRFRVEAPLHTPIIESSGHLELAMLEGLSDEKLCELLDSLAGGRLKSKFTP